MKENRNFSEKDLNLPDNVLDENKIKDQLNIESLIFRQAERCANAAFQDETIFAANVRVLLSMMPIIKRDQIEAREDEYKSVESHYEWKKFCGVPLGTIQNPINGSPYEVTNEITDWHKIFEMCLAELELSGVTWTRDNWLVETLKPKEDREEPVPTPIFEDKSVSAEDEPKVKEKKAVTCAICHNKQIDEELKKVLPGEGMRMFNPTEGKNCLIHKKCKPEAIVEGFTKRQ